MNMTKIRRNAVRVALAASPVLYVVITMAPRVRM